MSIILTFTKPTEVPSPDGKRYSFEVGDHEIEDYLAGWVLDHYADSLDRDSINRAEGVVSTVKLNDPTVNSAIAPIRLASQNVDGFKHPTPKLSNDDRSKIAQVNSKLAKDNLAAHEDQAKANGRPTPPGTLTPAPNEAETPGFTPANPAAVSTADTAASKANANPPAAGATTPAGTTPVH